MWPKGKALDETCWSDKDYCRATGNWYMLAKTEAESAAFEYGKQNRLDVVSVNPGYVFGPVMQPILNFSTLLLVQLAKGIYVQLEAGEVGDSVPNKTLSKVDTRDVAEAVLLVYEKPEAEGRYICSACEITIKDLVEKLQSLHLDLSGLDNFVSYCSSEHQFRLSTEKLHKLGWTCRPLEETLVDSIESYRESALLD